MFNNQARYFDWLTPVANALIGFLQILITGVGALVMQWAGFLMFNFFTPWFPLIVIMAFVFGVISSRRSPRNIWFLAAQMNIPALLIGIWIPFFLVGTCLTIPSTAAGVAFGRRLSRRGLSS